MLKIEHLSSGYGKKQVLYDISFEVNVGEIVLLSGNNGCGKSTLLRCIYNLLPLWDGSISFENIRTEKLRTSEMIKMGIAYLPQKNFCFENLTVNENLKIAGNILGQKDLREKIKEANDLLGLEKVKNKKPFDLSGGEKKLLVFAMSFMHNPKMILCDELFSGIDNVNSNIILSNIKKNTMRNNLTMIFSEHIDYNNRFWTKKIIMKNGAL